MPMKARSCVDSVGHGSLEKAESASARALRPKWGSAHFRRQVANVLASAIAMFATIDARSLTVTQSATTENIRPAASEEARSGRVASEVDPPISSASAVLDHSSDAIAPSEHLVSFDNRFRARLANRGLTYEVEYIAEVLSNVMGGLQRGTIFEGLLNAAVDFDIGKLTSLDTGLLHVSALYPHGRSLTENYTGDLFTLSNIDAPHDPRLFELWLEAQFARDRFSIRIGQLAADEEFATIDQGCLFINGTCGWPAILSANVPAPAYPQGALGARVAWRADKWYLQGAVFDGDPNPADDSGRPTNPNGVNYTLDEGALLLVEAGIQWDGETQNGNRPGSFKLGSWYHTATFEHLWLDDTGVSLASPLSSGQPARVHGSWGVYAALEQALWHESTDKDSDQGLGMFSRIGGAPATRSTVEFYAEGGLTYVGLIPGRDADTLGAAVVYGQISNQLRQLANDRNVVAGTSNPLPDYEMVIETAYRVQLCPGWTLQPCVEYIIHPGGSTAIHNALVLGIRSHLTL
ncbi:hypothetical protein GC207_12680 [bacterium]|nr:hypothetical protein [bacterium]